MGEVAHAVRGGEGRVLEAFVVGTAVSSGFFTSLVICVVSSRLGWLGLMEACSTSLRPSRRFVFAAWICISPSRTGCSGVYAAVLKNWVSDIMYGKEKHEWGVVVEEKGDGVVV